MSQTFYIATFGCRTNQADSAALREDFLEARFEEAENPTDADWIVVNSCTVTHRSDQQVRQLARRLRRDNPEARLVVTGCYAQRNPDQVSRIRGVDLVLGNTKKTELVQLTQSSGFPRTWVEPFEKIRAIDPAPAMAIGGKTRPFVKIQDGCDAKCTYCIIPLVRGPSRSVPPQQIKAQVEALIRNGFAEIVLTGIHIGTYGMHLQPRFPLDRLMEELASLPGLGRLRLSSIEPMEISRRVIQLAGREPRIAPHFHVCLQSGSDRILRRMLRPYRTDRFGAILEEIRSQLPQAGIGTDVIVGFPGEREADHEATLRFLADSPVTYVHVFPYSDRSGTEAARMEGKVDPKTIKRRAAEIRRLSERKALEFQRSFLGRELSFLSLTQTRGGRREALSGNYLKGLLPPHLPGNRLVRGRAVAEEGGYLLVEEVDLPEGVKPDLSPSVAERLL